jgi:two-component system response regulator HydG
MSDRGRKPFLAINCGAIPESLIESAECGTLFLDEFDVLSSAEQTRLLQVIQEGEMERVGDKHTLHFDVRIVSASNRSLQQFVEQGLFRQDLFYRLNMRRL